MRGDAAEAERLTSADPALAAAARARDPRRIATAADLGRVDAVRLLAGIGLDVNAGGGPTPLHGAAYHGHRDVAELLIELGADPTRRDGTFHATPAGWAEHAGHAELAEWLAERELAGA